MFITGKGFGVRSQKALNARICLLRTFNAQGSALMSFQSDGDHDGDGDIDDDGDGDVDNDGADDYLLCARHCPLGFTHLN